MTTSRINAYRWPARLVSHKPFAAERYFITSSSIWQVFFAENYDFSFFYFLCFVNRRIFCARCTISALFAGGKLPYSPLQHQYGREKRGVYLLYKERACALSVKACRLCQLSQRESQAIRLVAKALGEARRFPYALAPPWGSCRAATEGLLMEKRKKR